MLYLGLRLPPAQGPAFNVRPPNLTRRPGFIGLIITLSPAKLLKRVLGDALLLIAQVHEHDNANEHHRSIGSSSERIGLSINKTCISHSFPSPPRVHHGCVFISHLISSSSPDTFFLSLYLRTYTQYPCPIALVRPSICIRSDISFHDCKKNPLKPNARENAPSGSRKHTLIVVMRGWNKHAVITFNDAAARLISA